MTITFKLAITTELGSCYGEQQANSAEQLKEIMPDEVISYTATPLCENPDLPPVDDDELSLDLCTSVNNIEYASTLDEEEIARLHEEQLRALNSLTVRLDFNSNP